MTVGAASCLLACSGDYADVVVANDSSRAVAATGCSGGAMRVTENFNCCWDQREFTSAISPTSTSTSTRLPAGASGQAQAGS